MAHRHVVYGVQELSKTASKGAQTAAVVPEMSVVRSFDGSSTKDTDYGVFTPSRFHAYNCRLILALQTYDAVETRGVLTEKPHERHIAGWSVCSAQWNPDKCPYGNGTISSTQHISTDEPISISALAC